MTNKDTIRLTPKQKEVIKLMRGDYILKHQDSFGRSWWLSKKSGFHYLKQVNLRKATFDKLLSLGLIKRKCRDTYGHFYYNLTAAGKSIQL